MELFGVSIQTIYLAILIIAGLVLILFMLFGDILEGVAEASPFFNPTLILAFLTFFSALGYLLELLTSIDSILILVISAVVAGILDVLLNVFVLVPLSSAEESLVYTTDSLKGKIGKVIIPIPEDGFGEVLLKSNSGMVAKPAASFEHKPIEEGKHVLVIDIKEGVLLVIPHESAEDFFK